VTSLPNNAFDMAYKRIPRDTPPVVPYSTKATSCVGEYSSCTHRHSMPHVRALWQQPAAVNRVRGSDQYGYATIKRGPCWCLQQCCRTALRACSCASSRFKCTPVTVQALQSHALSTNTPCFLSAKRVICARAQGGHSCVGRHPAPPQSPPAKHQQDGGGG
jgi:hypothetical protein